MTSKQAQEEQMMDDKSYLIRPYNMGRYALFLKYVTQIMRTANIDLPYDIKFQGQQLISRMTPPRKNISDVKSSPQNTMTTIVGTVGY